jgi:hypothetical protein
LLHLIILKIVFLFFGTPQTSQILAIKASVFFFTKKWILFHLFGRNGHMRESLKDVFL